MKFLRVLSFSLFFAGGSAWFNAWDGVLNFVCPVRNGKHGSISRMQSVHDNGREDRLWNLECRYDIPTTGSCSWSGFVNGYDGLMNYGCPSNGYMAGAWSQHSNHHEDRIWRFLCCPLPLGRSNCRWSCYLNEWDGYMNHYVESGKIIHAAYSHHDNHREDRRWKVLECTANSASGRSTNGSMTVDRSMDDDECQSELNSLKEERMAFCHKFQEPNEELEVLELENFCGSRVQDQDESCKDQAINLLEEKEGLCLVYEEELKEQNSIIEHEDIQKFCKSKVGQLYAHESVYADLDLEKELTDEEKDKYAQMYEQEQGGD